MKYTIDNFTSLHSIHEDKQWCTQAEWEITTDADNYSSQLKNCYIDWINIKAFIWKPKGKKASENN